MLTTAYNIMASCATCPVYPPGVLQTVTIPDPTSLDGFGDLEITLIPSRSVTDINHFSEEGIQHFKEMLYEIDEEYRRRCDLKMEAIEVHLERFDRLANEVWDFNSGFVKRPDLWSWVNQEGPYDCSDCGWISHTDVPHFRDEYVAYVQYDIAEVLAMAEEDADYEDWINSEQYVKSLQEYNRHKLLAWDKVSQGEHPKWSGECAGDMAVSTVITSDTVARSDTRDPTEKCVLYNTFLKERYRVVVGVHTLNWGPGGRYYAFGTTPYGDVYIPQKITEYLKDYCGLYEMDIALQDVEGAPGKKPNSFRWTCVYLHNNGFSLK